LLKIYLKEKINSGLNEYRTEKRIQQLTTLIEELYVLLKG
jgi:hypothetical protein